MLKVYFVRVCPKGSRCECGPGGRGRAAPGLVCGPSEGSSLCEGTSVALSGAGLCMSALQGSAKVK